MLHKVDEDGNLGSQEVESEAVGAEDNAGASRYKVPESNGATQTPSSQEQETVAIPLVCKSCSNVNEAGRPVSICGQVAFGCIQALFSLDHDAEGLTPISQMERIRKFFSSQENMEALATTTERLKDQCRQSVPDLLKPPSLFADSLVLSERRALIDGSPVEDQILSAFRPLLFFSEESALAAVISASTRDLVDGSHTPSLIAAFFRFHSTLPYRFALLECVHVNDSPSGQVQLSFFDTDNAVCSHVANTLQQRNLVANEVFFLTYGTSCTVHLDEMADRQELPENEGVNGVKLCQEPRVSGQASQKTSEEVPLGLPCSPEQGLQEAGGKVDTAQSMSLLHSKPTSLSETSNPPPATGSPSSQIRSPANDSEHPEDDHTALPNSPLVSTQHSLKEDMSSRPLPTPSPQPSGSSRGKSPRKAAANEYSWMLSLQDVSIIPPIPAPQPAGKHASPRRANTMVLDDKDTRYSGSKRLDEEQELRDALREMFKQMDSQLLPNGALKRPDQVQGRSRRRQSSDDAQGLRDIVNRVMENETRGESSNWKKPVTRKAVPEEPHVNERSNRAKRAPTQAKPKQAEASSSGAASKTGAPQFYDHGQLDLLFGPRKPKKTVQAKPSLAELDEEPETHRSRGSTAGKRSSRQADSEDTDSKHHVEGKDEMEDVKQASVTPETPLSEKAKQKRRASVSSVDSFETDITMTARGSFVGSSQAGGSSRARKTPRNGDTWSPLLLRPELATKASTLTLRSEGNSRGEGSSSQLSNRASQQSFRRRPPKKSYDDSRNEFAWQLALVSKVIKPSDEYLKQQEQKFIELNPRYKPEKFECLICFEVVQGVDGSRCMNCEHSFCRDCLTGHVQANLEENIYPILCPVCFTDPERTSTRGYVDLVVLDDLDLTQKQLDKFSELETAAVIVKIDCPGCKQNLVIAREDYLENPYITCTLPGCDSRFCRACLMVTKGDNDQHECKIDKELDALMKEHGWLYCPGCRTPIQKDSGCNHMTCRTPGCSTHFCYVCGVSIWDSKSPQSLSTMLTEHYKNCNQFDVETPRARPRIALGGPAGARRRDGRECVVQ